jgi:hypothetical protein
MAIRACIIQCKSVIIVSVNVVASHFLQVLLALSHAAFYITTTFGDPGIVTSNMHDINTPCDWKHCETCDNARPFRAKHCPEPGCNRCINRFDHYCGFIGAPVGAGNEVPFMLFCLSAFLDAFISFLNGAWVLLVPSDSNTDVPGLLSLLREGNIVSMATMNALWQRALVVRIYF